MQVAPNAMYHLTRGKIHRKVIKYCENNKVEKNSIITWIVSAIESDARIRTIEFCGSRQ
jgi:hypothetical protein